MHYAIYNILYTIYNVQYTIYNIHYAIYNILYTIYNIQYTMYNVQYTITIYHIQSTIKNQFYQCSSLKINPILFQRFMNPTVQQTLNIKQYWTKSTLLNVASHICSHSDICFLFIYKTFKQIFKTCF